MPTKHEYSGRVHATGTKDQSKKFRALRKTKLKECYIVRYANLIILHECVHITDEDIQKIMSIDGIKAYNGLGDGSVFAKDFSFISGFSFGTGSDYSRLAQLNAATPSDITAGRNR